MEKDMKNVIVLALALFAVQTIAGDYNYVGSEHEMKLKDGTYEKTKQRIVIGRSIKINNYQTFAEVGFGEDITEGQSIGQGADYDYYKVGFKTKYFDALDVKVHFESKLNTYGKDDNELQINTKYKF
jgi:hypothetical protein